VHDGLGEPGKALNHYHQALPIQREVGDRAGEAATLNNIALVSLDAGDAEGALASFLEVGEILREVGDRRNEGTLRSSVAMVLAQLGRVTEAIEQQRSAVQLAEATRDPSLPEFRAFLDQLRAQVAQEGDEDG
jgi:tetratricopeptide (TPR) repeat protein